MPVQVITDSTCDLPAELLHRYGITIMPLQVVFEQTKAETAHRSATQTLAGYSLETLFEYLLKGERPRIAAPSTAQFEQIFSTLDQEAPIQAVLVSSRLSSTYHNAVAARMEMAKMHRINIFDSMTTTMALGMMVLEAAQRAAAGQDLDQIERALIVMGNEVHILMAAETSQYIEPEYLTSGPTQPLRVQLAQAQATRPMIRIENGLLQIQERVRTRAKALERLYEFVEMFPHIERLAIITSTGTDEVETLVKRIEVLYPRDQIILAHCSPLLSLQVGPAMIGIVVFEGEGH